ncbi:MAG: DUF4271 domain-containing protein [Prevotellaceae bacterium]|jgi:hypothetical protein|nr:DUF4271 domain-containing protein [Prevotellaceae bacterium]
MSLISGYISADKSCNTCSICNDLQYCGSSDVEISTTEMYSSKQELLHSSLIAEVTPNIFMNGRETTSWMISGLLILYIGALILSKKNMPVIGIMLFSKNHKNIRYNDLSHSFIRTTNILVAFSIFIISMFFYLIEKHASQLNKTPSELFTMIAIAVCLYFVFKILIIKITGYISENDGLKSKLFAIEIIILSIYILFSGFFLTLCFANPVYKVNIWLTVISAITLLLYLFKIFKIIMIFVDEKISPFFLILYLCAIEILPAWLIIDFL